mmetsp:Transcript_34146/g.105054  ORF Transcript_34146/g.105054 Transcript_34146/m.105054 type:complete len:208 (+) Transcript_34146:483-1106(+)
MWPPTFGEAAPEEVGEMAWRSPRALQTGPARPPWQWPGNATATAGVHCTQRMPCSPRRSRSSPFAASSFPRGTPAASARATAAASSTASARPPERHAAARSCSSRCSSRSSQRKCSTSKSSSCWSRSSSGSSSLKPISLLAPSLNTGVSSLLLASSSSSSSSLTCSSVSTSSPSSASSISSASWTRWTVHKDKAKHEETAMARVAGT